METEIVIELVCPSCRSIIEPSTRSCPSCGMRFNESSGADAASGHSPLQGLLDHRGLMLLVLFGATAGLGIPLLWKSRVFSFTAKLALTIILCVYTAVIFYLFWLVMHWSIDSIRGALA